MGCLTHYTSSLHHSQVSHPRERRKVGVTEGHCRRAEAFVERPIILGKGLGTPIMGGVVTSIYHDDHRRVRVISGTQFD